eukprot:scaffold285330_cov42-Prasinocladus_malaysianus.AAC.1
MTNNGRGGVATLLLLASLTLCLNTISGSTTVGRKLQATCQMDACGIWCGPPRAPPCGDGPPDEPEKCKTSYGFADHLEWAVNAGQRCQCDDGEWKKCEDIPKASCKAGNGKSVPHGAFGQNAEWKNCKCEDGEWAQCKYAKTCWAKGVQYGDGSWALNNDDAECKCTNGAWTQ